VAEGVTTTDRDALREAVKDRDSLRDSLPVAVTDCVNEGVTDPDGVGDATSHVKQPNV